MELRAACEELAHSGQGLFSATAARATGLSRPQLSRAVASGALLRVRPRVYSVIRAPELPRFLVTDAGVAAEYVWHVRAVLLGMGPGAAARGRTAAALYGWGMLVEPSRVEVAVDHGRGTQRVLGASVVQGRGVDTLDLRVLADTDRLRVTTPVQTVVDCALRLPLLQAVVVCDSALRGGHVSIEELLLAAGRLRGVRHAGRVARVLELCDPASGSVLESVLRVQLVLGDIAGFATQVLLCDKPVVRVDFCFAAARLVVEVDGARWHPDPARDQARDNALAAAGWRVLRFTWSQVLGDPSTVLAQIRAALDGGRSSRPLAAA